MATLLTLSGLLDWNPKILDSITTCIDYSYSKIRNLVVEDFDVGTRAQTKIILECGTLETIYQSPDILELAVMEWCASNRLRWSKMFATTLYDYNPIYNYDRTEETSNIDEVEEISEGENSGEIGGTLEKKIGAYNNDMQKTGEDVNNSRSAYEGRGKRTENKSQKHSARMFGNIGVTTTQEMIEQERRVCNYDIADIIAREFRRYFCVAVY